MISDDRRSGLHRRRGIRRHYCVSRRPMNRANRRRCYAAREKSAAPDCRVARYCFVERSTLAVQKSCRAALRMGHSPRCCRVLQENSRGAHYNRMRTRPAA